MCELTIEFILIQKKHIFQHKQMQQQTKCQNLGPFLRKYRIFEGRVRTAQSLQRLAMGWAVDSRWGEIFREGPDLPWDPLSLL